MQWTNMHHTWERSSTDEPITARRRTHPAQTARDSCQATKRNARRHYRPALPAAGRQVAGNRLHKLRCVTKGYLKSKNNTKRNAGLADAPPARMKESLFEDRGWAAARPKSRHRKPAHTGAFFKFSNRLRSQKKTTYMLCGDSLSRTRHVHLPAHSVHEDCPQTSMPSPQRRKQK